MASVKDMFQGQIKDGEYKSNDLFKDNSLSPADTFNIFNDNGSIMVKQLNYPLDITKSKAKNNRSLSLFILKDIAYEAALEAANEGLKESGIDTSKGIIGAGIDAITNPSKIINGYMGAVNKFKTNFTSLENFKAEDYHCVINLPIPNNLTEDDSQSYDDAGFGSNSNLFSGIKSTYDTVTQGLDDVIQSGVQVANDGGRRNSRQIRQLPVLNPFTWKKFKGSQLKEFQFTFFFVPRSKAEAKEMMQIVYTLKKYSYGSKDKSAANYLKSQDSAEIQALGDMAGVASNFFISAPPKVLLKFNNPMLQKLINPGVCVITRIGTTYQEGQTPSMTWDGVPRFLELNLALSEYNVRFSEDFKNVKN